MAYLSKINLDGVSRDLKDAEAFSTRDSTETNLADDDYVPFYDTSASAKKKTTLSTLITKIKSGITSGVSGVKGNAETSYRTGNVNLTPTNIGLGNVGNFKAVSTVASQGLTTTEQSNARTNIGAGTSNLTIGTTSSTAAAGNHTHPLSLAANSGTSSLSMTKETKYKLTAGGNNIIFTTPGGVDYSELSPVNENTGYASQKYQIGSVILVNNELYRVIGDCYQGDPLVVGTNIEKYSICQRFDKFIGKPATFSDVFTITVGQNGITSIPQASLTRIMDHIYYVTLDIRGSFAKGDTTIGSCVNPGVNLSQFIGGRAQYSSSPYYTYPSTLLFNPAGAIRTHCYVASMSAYYCGLLYIAGYDVD